MQYRPNQQQPSPSLLHPDAQEALDSLVDRLNAPFEIHMDNIDNAREDESEDKLLKCILLCTADGVPLCRSFGSESIYSKNINYNSRVDDGEDVMLQNIESIMATFPVMASTQLRPFGSGPVKTITAFYNNLLVLHVFLSPCLVLTFVGGSEMNVGAVHSILPKLTSAIEPIKVALLAAAQQTADGDAVALNMNMGGTPSVGMDYAGDMMSSGHY